jgi:hypothetical protein
MFRFRARARSPTAATRIHLAPANTTVNRFLDKNQRVSVAQRLEIYVAQQHTRIGSFIARVSHV